MSKSTKKTTSNKKNTKSEKTELENKRIATILDTMIVDQVICPFPEFGSKGFADKCGVQLVNAILHEINRIKSNLAHDSKGVDNFPAEKFNLLGDKANKSGKRQVKSSSAVPTKKRAPRKKGQKVVDEPEESEDSIHEEEPAVEVKEVKEVKEEKKTVKKTSAVQVQRSAKNELMFLFNNFIFEVYSIADDEDVSNNDYVDHVLGGLLDTFPYSASRVIIPAVEMNRNKIYDMDDDSFTSYLNTLGKKTDLSQRPKLLKMTVEYIVNYTRLLGITLANILWSRRAAINSGLLEAAVRLLNIGVEQYLSTHFDGNVPLKDLSYGVLSAAHEFDITLYPPPSKEVKEERAANRKKKAAETKARKKTVTEEKKETVVEEDEDEEEVDEDIAYEGGAASDEDEDDDDEPPKKKGPKKLNSKH